jgi:hypothetical protein
MLPEPGGLLVLATPPNVQFTVQVEATTKVPITLEAASHMLGPITRTPRSARRLWP